MVEIYNEPVRNVNVKVVVSDETGQEERDISITWLKCLGLRDVLDGVEEAVGGIE